MCYIIRYYIFTPKPRCFCTACFISVRNSPVSSIESIHAPPVASSVCRHRLVVVLLSSCRHHAVSSSSRRHHVSSLSHRCLVVVLLSSRRHHVSSSSRYCLVVVSLPSLCCHRHRPCQPHPLPCPPPSLPLPSLARHPCRCHRCLAALVLFVGNHSHRLRHHPRPCLFVTRHPSHRHHHPHCSHLCPRCCRSPATLVAIAIALFVARHHRAVDVAVARPPPFLPSP